MCLVIFHFLQALNYSDKNRIQWTLRFETGWIDSSDQPSRDACDVRHRRGHERLPRLVARLLDEPSLQARRFTRHTETVVLQTHFMKTGISTGENVVKYEPNCVTIRSSIITQFQSVRLIFHSAYTPTVAMGRKGAQTELIAFRILGNTVTALTCVKWKTIVVLLLLVLVQYFNSFKIRLQRNYVTIKFTIYLYYILTSQYIFIINYVVFQWSLAYSHKFIKQFHILIICIIIIIIVSLSANNVIF